METEMFHSYRTALPQGRIAGKAIGLLVVLSLLCSAIVANTQALKAASLQTVAYPLSTETLRYNSFFKADTSIVNDQFATSVAVDGDVMVVGAHLNDGAGGSLTDSGVAYVYERDANNQWTLSATLRASNAGAQDNFGHSVAVSGDLIAVGAPLEDSNALGVHASHTGSDAGNPNYGAVYLFERNGASWQQLAYIKSQSLNSNQAFGSALALSGSYLLVGSPKERLDTSDNTSDISGAAYLFDFSSASVVVSRLTASDASANAQFGASVALLGERAVIGANNPSGLGAAYVFEADGGVWSESAILQGDNTGAQDLFGQSIALDAERIVVGAPNEDSASADADSDTLDNSGSVYVFEQDGSGDWLQSARLKAANAGAQDAFGTSVALRETVLVVGAPGEASNNASNPDNNSASLAGAAYLFQRDAQEVWAQSQFIKATTPTSGERFGNSVVIDLSVPSQPSLIISSPLDGKGVSGINPTIDASSKPNSGAAYSYDLLPNLKVQYNNTTLSNNAAAASSNGTDFGDIWLNDHASSTFTIDNIGGLSDLTWATESYTITGSHAADFTVVFTPSTVLAPRDSLDLSVTFVPSGVGLHEATLTLQTLEREPFVINFSANGVEPVIEVAVDETVVVPSDLLTFNTVLLPGGTDSKTVVITNTGTAPLTISEINILDDTSNVYSTDTSPTGTIAMGDSVTFNLQFAPLLRGSYSASLQLLSDELNVPVFTIGFTGEALAPIVTLSGNNQPIANGSSASATNNTDFANARLAGTPITNTFSINNSGDIDLVVSSINISGTHAGDFSLVALPNAPVAANDSVEFSLVYAPLAEGLSTAQIEVITNDPATPSYVFSVQGNAQTPHISFAANRIELSTMPNSDFGSVRLNSQLEQSFVIYNTGTAPLDISKVSISGASEFSIVSSPLGAIQPNGNATIVVRFAPSTPGSKTATITIESDDLSEASVSFAVQATGAHYQIYLPMIRR
jgi:hypothetical protein